MASNCEEAAILVVFAWFVPSAVCAIMLGFAEQFSYDLRGCRPDLGSWLRYGFLQYVLIFFLIVYLNFMPRKYSIYFDRFLNQGHVSFALAWVFVLMQVITPWITLTLYLQLRKVCSDRMTTGHAVFYWIIFSLQVLVFLIGAVVMYFFYGIFEEEIISEYRTKKSGLLYIQQATKIIKSGTDIKVLYKELLDSSYFHRSSFFSVDLLLFKKIFRMRLDFKCAQILMRQDRKCFRCKSGFGVGDFVQCNSHCHHLVHWECFYSAIAINGHCPECKTYIVSSLKRSIRDSSDPDLETLIMVPPCVKPSYQELTSQNHRRRHPWMAIQNPVARPIVTIEYFNYTVDQKTGGEPAEALPAPVAETEI